jgi:hypothetical protein
MTTAAVTAAVSLPDLPLPILMLRPLTPAQASDLHGLPPVNEAPDAFAPVSTVLRVKGEDRRLRLAVFRFTSPGQFLAVPDSGDVEVVRASARALRPAA